MERDEDRFWESAASLLTNHDVTRSTMMGLPCLRVRGAFFAAFDRATGNLMFKVPASRVAQLVAAGDGLPVAPAGRIFREWVAIPPEAVDTWPGYLDEGFAFVSSSN